MKSTLLLLGLCCTFLVRAQHTDTVTLGTEVYSLSSSEKIFNVYGLLFNDIIAFQFSMEYDDSKMTFNRVQNASITGFNGSNIGANYPDLIAVAYLDPSLEGISLPDSTVIFQIVFDVIESGGSSLCLTEAVLPYEFVFINEELSQFYLHDDCFSGLVVIEESTSTADQAGINAGDIFSDVMITSQGLTALTLANEVSASWILRDISGKITAQVAESVFQQGRQTIDFNTSLLPGIYFLSAKTAGGVMDTQKVSVMQK